MPLAVHGLVACLNMWVQIQKRPLMCRAVVQLPERATSWGPGMACARC